MATTKRKPATPGVAEVPLPAADNVVTIDDSDVDLTNDISGDDLEAVVPGLPTTAGDALDAAKTALVAAKTTLDAALTASPQVPATIKSARAAYIEARRVYNALLPIGNTVVTVPPAGATVVLTVQVLPTVDPAKPLERPAAAAAGLVILVDALNGTVPGPDGITRVLRTPPLVVRQFKAGEAIFEQTTGKYYVATAGKTVPDAAAVAAFEAADKSNDTKLADELKKLYTGLATFEVKYAEVKENLDDWDDLWEPDLDYTFDYAAQAKMGRDTTGAFSTNAVDLPVDPLDATDGLYTEDVKAAAAKTVFWTDATFVSGSVPPKKCESNQEWADHFDLVYRDANDRYHPSVVGALRAALYAAADDRPDEYYQLGDPADPAKTGQNAFVADTPGAAADLKQADDNTLINPLAP